MKPISFHTLRTFIDKGARYSSMLATGEVTEDIKEKARIGRMRRRFILQPDTVLDIPVVPGEHLTPSGALSTKEATRKWLDSLDPYVFVTPKEMEEWSTLANVCHDYAPLFMVMKDCQFEIERQTEEEGMIFSARAHMVDSGVTYPTVHALHTCRDFNDAVKNIRDLYQLEKLVWTADIFSCEIGSIFVVETENGMRVRQFLFDSDVIMAAVDRVKRWTATWVKARDNPNAAVLQPKTLSLHQIKGA